MATILPEYWHPDEHVADSSRLVATCREHDPAAEIWLGVRTAGTEVPERVDVIVEALRAAGHRPCTGALAPSATTR